MVKDIFDKNSEQFKELGKHLANDPNMNPNFAKWCDKDGKWDQEAIAKKAEHWGKKWQAWC